MPTRKRTFKEIVIDFMGELPPSEGFNTILVITDWFSKVQHYIAAKPTWTAEDVANFHINDIWRLHGLPKYITLDHGPQFASKFLKQLNQSSISTSTFPVPNTCKHMDLVYKWFGHSRNTSAYTLMTGKTAGEYGYLWQNLLITLQPPLPTNSSSTEVSMAWMHVPCTSITSTKSLRPPQNNASTQ